MSSVDISALGQVKPSVAPSVPPPRPAKKAFVLAPAAEYDLRVITPITNETLKVSQTGNLNFKYDAEIVSGPFAGQKARFQNASAAVYEQDGVSQSRLGNMVAALGGTLPGVGDDKDATPQVRALESVIGNTFRAYVTWAAKDTKFGSGIDVKGMSKFPTTTDENGATVRQHYFEIPGQTDDKGRTARVWANLEISNYVPKQS